MSFVTMPTEILRTVITLPYLTPGLNGKDGLIREHWTAAERRKEAIYWDIASATKRGTKHKGTVRIIYRRYTVTLMDWDNAAASFKHIGDALVKCKLIADDNPRIVARFVPEQVQVGSRREQKTEIIIESFLQD